MKAEAVKLFFLEMEKRRQAAEMVVFQALAFLFI
jgi:hypothetical protein